MNKMLKALAFLGVAAAGVAIADYFMTMKSNNKPIVKVATVDLNDFAEDFDESTEKSDGMSLKNSLSELISNAKNIMMNMLNRGCGCEYDDDYEYLRGIDEECEEEAENFECDDISEEFNTESSNDIIDEFEEEAIKESYNTEEHSDISDEIEEEAIREEFKTDNK